MKRYLILSVVVGFVAWSGFAAAHALVERSIPASGATLDAAPQSVTIYFDAELEPVFSKLVVKNAQGVKVSAGDGEIVTGNSRALAARLAATGKGAYRVYWNVVSHDGHRAQGEFSFTVR